MVGQDLLESFLDEILDALINIDIELNKLALNPRDTQQLNRVYQMFHKIKYDCNIIRATRLYRIAEATERLIEQVQLHQQSLEKLPIDLLKKAADAFTVIVRSLLRDRVEGVRDFGLLVESLNETAQAIHKNI